MKCEIDRRAAVESLSDSGIANERDLKCAIGWCGESIVAIKVGNSADRSPRHDNGGARNGLTRIILDDTGHCDVLRHRHDRHEGHQ